MSLPILLHYRTVYSAFFRIATVVLLLSFQSTILSGNDSDLFYPERVITVKGDKQFFPFEFLNELGEADGFSVELAKEVFRRANLKYTIELDDWDEVQHQLYDKEIDMAVGMIYSAERAEKVLFGIPHYMISYNIVCRKGNDFSDMKSLIGKQIIVQNNDRAHIYLKSTGLTDNIIVVDKILDGIKKLSSGEGDALISFDMTASYFVKKGRFKNLKIHPANINPEKYSMVVNVDNEALLYTLNATLYQMKMDGEYDKIYYKWFGVYEQNHIYKIVYYIGIILCIIILMSAIFIFLLNRKVIVISRSLQKKNEESEMLKREFLESMSHEIRTPLNAIVGFSSLMIETEEQEKRAEFFDYINMNNSLLLKLINDMLDISLIQAEAIKFIKSKFTISSIFDEIATNYKNEIKPGVELLIDIKYDCELYTDKARLRQAIMNIFLNAIKFTESGSITLSSLKEDKNKVRISIKDTGVGIPNSKIDAIFDRFMKVSDYTQGTGLGLTISKQIIERLGGTIGVTSHLGIGSEFWIIIPQQS